jgi:alcohol dehydrogenase class IV
MRALGGRDPEAMCRIARALDAWSDVDAREAAPHQAAAALEAIFQSAQMPVRVSQLGIPRASLPQIVERSLKNFNADPKREFVREREMLLATLESAW